MFRPSTPYISALIIASIMNALLAVYAYRHRRKKAGAIAYMGLVIATAFYSIGYAFEITSSILEDIIFWLKIEYIGVSFLPALWLIFALEYAGADKYLTRSFIMGLFVIPVLTFMLHYTNSVHHLFYSEVDIASNGPFTVAILTKGPWYWVHLAYIYLSLFGGNFLFLKMYRRTAPCYKLQAASMLIGSLLPLAGNFIYLIGKSPWGLDLSPFMIALASPLYACALFRFGLFDLIPVARDKVFEGMREGVLVLDEQNRIVDVNPAVLRILPELSENINGQPVEAVLSHPELIQQILADSLELEIKIANEKDVQYFHSRISPVTNRRGQSIGKTVVLSNITEKVRLLEKLHLLATIDEMTKVYNRRHFMQSSRNEIERAKRFHKPIALVMMDIDCFKLINDDYGHAAGDYVLQAIAQRCTKNIRPTDLLGRYGGEEFVLCLPDTAREAAYSIAERLLCIVAEKPVQFEDKCIFVTASFGVTAAIHADQADLDRLLRQADQALYQAKAAGRNCVVLYQEA